MSWRPAESPPSREPLPSAEWMRLYFRHARAIFRNTNQLLEQVPRDRSSLYRSFQRWRSRVSNEDFSVVDGRVYLQQSAGARDPMVVLRLFTFMRAARSRAEPRDRAPDQERASRPGRRDAAGRAPVGASARTAGCSRMRLKRCA